MNRADQQPAKNSRLAGSNVLLIEDDVWMLRKLGSALIQLGARVTTAFDGKTGFDAFLTGRPDIVVTDIIMPERDGIEVLQAIKKISPHTPVLAISGGGNVGPDGFLELATRFGADAAVGKPLNVEEVTDLLDRLLEVRR